jgi:hypothetical protein
LQNQIILSLDLLVTLTSFSDGQSWTVKQPDLVDSLVQLAKDGGPAPRL